MPGCMIPLILFVFFMPVLFAIVFFNIAAISFTKLGLSSGGALILFMSILFGSMVNIPVSRKRYYTADSTEYQVPFLFYYPPQVRERVIAVNLGGAIIPTVFSLYLLTKAPLLQTMIATLIIVLVCKRLARPVPGVGIKLPAFIPPLVAALVAIILSPGNAAPVAFISGVLGTLIGADLLNLHWLDDLGAQVLSIGGAGVFDGIFLVGVVAAFLT
ncbi:MAG: DUF1614 domain-containing protein [Clostridia bacterium]|nr:DUF1614 domain-containing protein [Clostridia bacterium]